MRIYLIRHGRQNSPLCNVNVPLSDAGKRQAELLGERLKKESIDAAAPQSSAKNTVQNRTNISESCETHQ